MSNRRLLHEPLESRQLLAANCVAAADLADPAELGLASPTVAEAESVVIEEDGVVTTDVILPEFAPNYHYAIGWGPDLVQERGNKLFVVDQHPDGFLGAGQLVIFERADDGSLSPIEEIDLDIRVSHMFLRGNQVVLIGSPVQPPWPAPDGGLLGTGLPREIPNTVALTINLGQQTEVIKQELDGWAHFVDYQDDRIVMVSTTPEPDVFPLIYPPPERFGWIQTFGITGDGLGELASATTKPLYGKFHVDGDTLIHTRVAADAAFNPEVEPGQFVIDFHGENNGVIVTQYHLGESSIDEVGELKLGRGYMRQVDLFDDGETAVVVRSGVDAKRTSHVEILDLSGEQPRLFQSIPVPGAALEIYSDYVLLTDHHQALFIVDTNKSIDLAAENRVRRLAIPEGLRVHFEPYRASDGQVVLMAERATNVDKPERLLVPWDMGPPARVIESLLLTISLPEARMLAETSLGEGRRFGKPEQFFEIDAKSDRFAFLTREASTAGTRGTRFVFGSLDENGKFAREGSIPVGHWLELDANGQRLLARETDRLVEYRWEDTEDPIITPLGEPNPVIEAADDEYTVYEIHDEHLFEVLANDVLHRVWGFGVEITRLLGAPEGSKIVAGRYISIPGEALEGIDSLQFEYVISDGRTESSAVVEISSRPISDQQVRELVAQVRAQAAEDFDLPIDQVHITSVQRIFDRPLPVVPPDDPNAPIEYAPGILVKLFVPDAKARYAASLDGRITQVSLSQREILMELGLRAVDENGEVLEQLVAGEEFYLEFTAKDLRNFGDGVYSGFFDLLLPTEHVVLTGPVEYLQGFTSISQGGFDEGQVDDLGAIGSIIEHPGNALQQLLRIRAQAGRAGEVTLKPTTPDLVGSEILLRGSDELVDPASVRWKSLTMKIVDPEDPLDADGNGDVTAADALVVLNFLRRFSTTTLDELGGRLAEGELTDDTAKMRRYDTNRNGQISALDALVVINRLEQQAASAASRAASREAELVAAPPSALAGSALDDDDEETISRLF